MAPDGDLNPTLAESESLSELALHEDVGGGRLEPFLRWESGLGIAAVLVVIFGVLASSSFLTQGNLFYLCLSIGEVALMTLPMTLIVVTGEIDLSVASTMGMASAIVGYLWMHGASMPVAIGAALLAGAVGGLFNGLLVTRLGLPSLAVTIGTLTLFRGIAVILLGPNTVSNFPARYTNIGVQPVGHTGFLSFSVVCFLVLAVVVGVVLHATPFGRTLYAMGHNKEAALYAGIRVKRTKTLLFVFSGLVSAFAGILLTFRLATSVQDNGVGLELNVVAIVLLGGVSIFGGRGTIGGVLLAVFVFAALQNALFLTNFDQRGLGVVTGALLLVSVLVPNARYFSTRIRELGQHRRRLRAVTGQG
jgi:rhamnose transport system permease protein